MSEDNNQSTVSSSALFARSNIERGLSFVFAVVAVVNALVLAPAIVNGFMIGLAVSGASGLASYSFGRRASENFVKAKNVHLLEESEKRGIPVPSPQN